MTFLQISGAVHPFKNTLFVIKMDKIGLRFRFNLQQLATTASAIYLWELLDIKEEIIALLPTADATLKHSLFFAVVEYPSFLNEIAAKVVQRLESIYMPEKVRKEIQEVIPLIGEQILIWAVYVNYELKLTPGHLEKTYWTSVGTIDQSKFVQDHMKERRIEFDSTRFVLHTPENNFVYSLETLLHSNPESFLLCSNDDLKNGVKYFASQSNENKISSFISTVIEKYKQLGDRNCVHLKSNLDLKYLQILMLLINELPGRKFTEFINDVTYMFLDAWPYQELALQILSWVYDNKIEADFHLILRSIFEYLKRPDSTQYNKRKRMYLKTLQKLLDVMEAQNLEFRPRFYRFSINFFDVALKMGDFEYVNSFLDEVAPVDDGEKKLQTTDDRNLFMSLLKTVKRTNFELAKKLADFGLNKKKK